jgi:hypothetical protein
MRTSCQEIDVAALLVESIVTADPKMASLRTPNRRQSTATASRSRLDIRSMVSVRPRI